MFYMYLEGLSLFPVSEPVWQGLNLPSCPGMPMSAGPLKRSRKESGRSVSSVKVFCAHSLIVITIVTILNTVSQIYV